MGLTQMNNQPTRKENILNLYFTNSPTLVRHIEMIPGIGDHDSAIKVDSMIKPMVSQCKPRKIYQYHKGDMTALKADLKDFQDTFLANCDGKSAEELWLSFHSQMMILQEKHIPSKISKPQTSMPWINEDLKKKIRRNNRLFKSRKKSQKRRSNFLKNRRNLQKQMRQARWDHMLLLSTHSSLIIGGSPLLLSDGDLPPASPASHLAGLLRRRDPSTNPGPIAWWVSVGN